MNSKGLAYTRVHIRHLEYATISEQLLPLDCFCLNQYCHCVTCLHLILTRLWRWRCSCSGSNWWTTYRHLQGIVRVSVELNRTVVVDSDCSFDNMCGSHLQSQSGLYHVSWWHLTLDIDRAGQKRRDVLGLLPVVSEGRGRLYTGYDVIAFKDSKCHLCFWIRLLLQFNGRFCRLSSHFIVVSFESRSHGAGNC